MKKISLNLTVVLLFESGYSLIEIFAKKAHAWPNIMVSQDQRRVKNRTLKNLLEAAKNLGVESKFFFGSIPISAWSSQSPDLL